MFAIFDFGQYAITRQSLRTLANAGARAMMVQLGNLEDAEGPISCYAYGVKYNNLPAVCTAPRPMCRWLRKLLHLLLRHLNQISPC